MDERLTHVPDSAESWHPTRRTLITAALAAGGSFLIEPQEQGIRSGGECWVRRTLPAKDRYNEIRDYRDEYPSDSDFLREVASSVSVDTISTWEQSRTEDGSTEGILSLSEPTFVVIKVGCGMTDDYYALRTLEVEHTKIAEAEGEEEQVNKYYVPLQLTGIVDSAYSMLYTLPAGDHKISAKAGKYAKALSNHEITITPKKIEGAEFAMTLLNFVQRLHIRPDNVNRVMRNMPLETELVIGRNEVMEILAQYKTNLTGQDGGTNYCVATKPNDLELMSFAKFTSDGNLIERKSQAGAHHSLIELDDRRDLQIDTQNNVPSFVIKTDEMFALVPQIFVLNDDEIESLRVAGKVFAYRERDLKGQGEMQRKKLLEFITEELGGMDVITGFAGY